MLPHESPCSHFPSEEAVTLRLHSLETCSATDGPGLRAVLFTQGCPLRCQYCHNPDTWSVEGGDEWTLDALMNLLSKNKPYFVRSGGGVTVSGGEPLKQAANVMRLFQRCHAEGLHTALDTSGFCRWNPVIEGLIDETDLVLLDMKAARPEVFQNLAGVPQAPTLQFLEQLQQRGKRIWLRHVLIPGITLEDSNLLELAELIAPFRDSIERIDFLGYHTLGKHKWKALGMAYSLKDCLPVDKATVAEARAKFNEYLNSL